jgi:hypothetical protein
VFFLLCGGGGGGSVLEQYSVVRVGVVVVGVLVVEGCYWFYDQCVVDGCDGELVGLCCVGELEHCAERVGEVWCVEVGVTTPMTITIAHTINNVTPTKLTPEHLINKSLSITNNLTDTSTTIT